MVQLVVVAQRRGDDLLSVEDNIQKSMLLQFGSRNGNKFEATVGKQGQDDQGCPGYSQRTERHA